MVKDAWVAALESLHIRGVLLTVDVSKLVLLAAVAGGHRCYLLSLRVLIAILCRFIIEALRSGVS